MIIVVAQYVFLIVTTHDQNTQRLHTVRSLCMPRSICNRRHLWPETKNRCRRRRQTRVDDHVRFVRSKSIARFAARFACGWRSSGSRTTEALCQRRGTSSVDEKSGSHGLWHKNGTRKGQVEGWTMWRRSAGRRSDNYRKRTERTATRTAMWLVVFTIFLNHFVENILNR